MSALLFLINLADGHAGGDQVLNYRTLSIPKGRRFLFDLKNTLRLGTGFGEAPELFLVRFG